MKNLFFILCLSLLHYFACAQTDSLYRIAINKADYAYDFKWLQKVDDPADKPKFEIARELYNYALQIKPNESYPKVRLHEIDKILYDFKTKPIFQKLISVADSLFKIDNYSEAKKYYIKADSLYSESHAKEKLTAIVALSELLKNPSLVIDSVKHGTSFGMCDGYCYNEITVTKNSISNRSRSWKEGDPDKIKTLKTKEEYWKQILQSIDLKTFYKMPQTIGCPDCLDNGAEWIGISAANNYYVVAFDYGLKIDELNALLEFFRETNK